MLGLDNPIHLLFVGVLLLLVFGAKRLPELGQSLGSGLRGFKESISGDTPAPAITDHVVHVTPDADEPVHVESTRVSTPPAPVA
jgi:sec-independent protein translocase protein TatA